MAYLPANFQSSFPLLARDEFMPPNEDVPEWQLPVLKWRACGDRETTLAGLAMPLLARANKGVMVDCLTPGTFLHS